MTDFSLYHASITAMLAYKQAEAVFRLYAENMTSFQPDSEYFRLKTARDRARREYEKAEREWKREYARSQEKINEN